MSTTVPGILKLAERVTVEIELAVSRWPRCHKYTHGSELRLQAMAVWRLATQTWRAREQRGDVMPQLVKAVDDLKLSLQLGKQIRAFASFAQFEAIARLVADLGKQVGGWSKRVNGQNAPAVAPAQRPEILSSQTASHEAMR